MTSTKLVLTLSVTSNAVSLIFLKKARKRKISKNDKRKTNEKKLWLTKTVEKSKVKNG